MASRDDEVAALDYEMRRGLQILRDEALSLSALYQRLADALVASLAEETRLRGLLWEEGICPDCARLFTGEPTGHRCAGDSNGETQASA